MMNRPEGLTLSENLTQRKNCIENLVAKLRKLNSESNFPYSVLAVRFNVSSATIRRICRPDYYERQKAANRKYQSENLAQITKRRKGQYRDYNLSFHKENDREVISFLDSCDSIQDYVRQCVMKDLSQKTAKDSLL